MRTKRWLRACILKMAEMSRIATGVNACELAWPGLLRSGELTLSIWIKDTLSLYGQKCIHLGPPKGRTSNTPCCSR